MATRTKKSPAKAKTSSRGKTPRAATKKAAPKKAAKKQPLKSAAKKAVKKAASTAKKAASSVKKTTKKLAAKAPVKKALKSVKRAAKKTVASAKKTVRKVAAKKPAKKAVKAVRKTAAQVKQRVAGAEPKASGAKTKASKPSPAKASATKKRPLNAGAAKPHVSENRKEEQHHAMAEKPLSTLQTDTVLHVTSPAHDKAEHEEHSHLTAQAVKTEGVPAPTQHEEKHSDEKPVSPADVATIGMNNKQEILTELSVKHANNHKLSNQKIAGKKPLW